MGKVRKSVYRKPVTADGLRKMENEELDWFDPVIFANFGSGILEQYLDEKNRTHPNGAFVRSKFIWKKVAIGIAIGSAFALINQYVGLKVGLITGGAWYVTYLIGLAMRWGPSETNIGSGAATGADRTATGFVFTFPAIYLLAYATKYVGSGGKRLIEPASIGPLLPVALISAMLGGFLGIMYFIIFRRIWLVEDPLPMPTFPAYVKLMDIANDLSRGALEQAKKSLKTVTYVAGGIMGFVFLRDFPLIPKSSNGETVQISIMDRIFGGDYYSHGTIHQPYSANLPFHIGFTFTPIQFAIGWFLRFRIALLVALGTFLTFFVIVPLAVMLDLPVYIVHVFENGAVAEGFFSVNDPYLVKWGIAANAAELARDRIGRIIAIGAILGGGITGLLKMLPVFKTATADIRKIRGGEERRDWVKGRGWYEWPVDHIKIMMIITFIGVGAMFTIGGFPWYLSFVFSAILVGVTFILGAIAVKVAGEIGTTPVSGTSFITLLLLVGVFTAIQKIAPFNTDIIIIMALLGTAVFGSAISLSSDIMWDFRVGLYCGTRPYHLIKGEMTGIFFGSTVAVLGATLFSYGLAQGIFDLEAPQAHAFATFSQILMGGKIQFSLLALGIGIGVFAELLTGMGTSFGLGMYLSIWYIFPMVLSGALRDIWEKKWLEPTAKRLGWTEREKTLKTLTTYMMAAGLLIGEALMGTIIAIVIVLPLLAGKG